MIKIFLGLGCLIFLTLAGCARCLVPVQTLDHPACPSPGVYQVDPSDLLQPDFCVSKGLSH